MRTWPDGRRYEGQFLQDAEDGEGVMTLASGLKVEGTWRLGMKHDICLYTRVDGSTYEVHYSYGKVLKSMSRIHSQGNRETLQRSLMRQNNCIISNITKIS